MFVRVVYIPRPHIRDPRCFLLYNVADVPCSYPALLFLFFEASGHTGSVADMS